LAHKLYPELRLVHKGLREHREQPEHKGRQELREQQEHKETMV
jgi:hypothetical protein